MHVVWIAPHYPSAREGGAAAHQFELIRTMRSRHSIHVICREPERTNVADLERIGVTFDFVKWSATPPPRNRIAGYWRLFAEDPGVSRWHNGHSIDDLSAALVRHASATKVDLVQVVMTEAAPVLAHADAPSALLLFDVFVRQANDAVRDAPNLRHRILEIGRRRQMRRFERHWYARSDVIACVSSVDAEFVSKMTSRRVEVIPNPIPDAFFEAPTVERSSSSVVLVATLDYGPNIDSVRWVCERIWPRVLARRPDASLRIAGWNPTREVRELAARAGADLLPNVPDVRPLYWQAAVAIAPVRLGSGLRNKVLHAIACGAPVVATTNALEGMDLADGRDLLVRDEAEDFADAIVDALRDRRRSAERAAAALTALGPYRSDVVADRLDAFWRRAVERPSRRRTG
jgi:glycosyltransferase involved in cell wall biosynthesis